MKLNKKKLELERKRMGVSKAAFSRLAKLHPSSYGKMLSSESTKLTTITRLAAMLHVNPTELIQ